MGVNGKSKGSQFEREVANKLSERFSGYMGLEQAFRRNIDSGSFFGGKNSKRTSTHDTSKATFGDIVCPDGFRFTIETKFYKKPPSFNAILNQYVPEFDLWIDQAESDAFKAGKRMALIVKYNRTDEFVILDSILPDYINHIIAYKDMYIMPLKIWLNHENSYFFEEK